MALIPTLTLWHVEFKGESPEEFEKGMNMVVLPELRAYSEAGGQILFGTDSPPMVPLKQKGFNLMNDIGMTTTQYGKVMGGNAARLLKLN